MSALPRDRRFGPQTQHVDDLLGKAAALEPSQRRDLTVAWLGHQGNALRAAAARARDLLGWSTPPAGTVTDDTVPRDGFIDAWASGLRAGGGSSGGFVVAWAALAVAARHILPVDVYADLTAPWAAVVGRAHPDDVRTVEDSMWPSGRCCPPAAVGAGS